MVDRGFGELSPCSLFMLAVVDTGSRKTRADRVVMSTIEEYDFGKREEYKDLVENYRNERKSFRIKEIALERAYTRLLTKVSHNPSDREAVETLERIELQLGELRSLSSSITEPKLQRVLYSSIPMRELERSLCENWPAAGLISNEAADFLNARNESDMARLDRLWDGQSIDVVGRTDRESFWVKDPRFTMSLMIQPTVFDGFLAKKGERAKGVGFIPRMLISRPDTLYGQRTTDGVGRATDWIDKFNKRILDFLRFGHQSLEKRSSSRVRLYFSPAAQQAWARDYDKKEMGAADGGPYVYEREFINRYSEHVARLAALFHFFESADLRADGAIVGGMPDVEIPESVVADAISVAEWYLAEFSRIFNPEKSIKEAANHVFIKFRERLAAKNNGSVPERAMTGFDNIRIPASQLRNFCTRSDLREDKERFQMALDLLVEQHKINIREEAVAGSKRKTKFVELVIDSPYSAYSFQRE
ncbi:Uncharacterised protein [Burkholderia oklahomensis]|nr:hypothetical protein BG90_117 [Burkholderia oklahomensis C6786]SUW60446.1 Uncharacterised protein [Burkholderia oklahomensis]